MEIIKCICNNKVYHSKECKRKNYELVLRLKRMELRRKRLCITCQKKVKPYYYQYCEKHRKMYIRSIKK